MSRLTLVAMSRLKPGTIVLRRFGTINIAGDLPDGHVRDDYARMIASGVDLFGVEESQGRDASDYVPAGWTTLQARTKGARGRCAIHWRTAAFQLLARGNPLLHLAQGLMFPSAVRYFEWARLRDLDTLRIVTFIVVHFVPHADDNYGGITTMPRRRLVLAAIRAIIRLVQATSRGQVIVVGDWNVNLRADLRHHDPRDLVEQLQVTGLVPVPAILGHAPPATHGRNAYDTAFLRWRRNPARRYLHPVRDWVLPRGWTDHLGYVFEAEWTVRRRS